MLGAIVLGLTSPAAATLLPDWDLDELVRRADRVVVGTVEAQSFVVVDRVPMTETRVAVRETLLGPKGDALVVSQLGGRVGDLVAEVPGDAKLVKGQRVLLFTFRHRDGRRYLVGMALGAYTVEGDALVQRLSAPRLGAGGEVLPAAGERRLSLSAVRRTVARLRP